MSDQNVKALPQYQSHKIVNACKIKEIVRSSDGSAVITPKEKGHKPFSVTRHYMTKHQPRTSGYYVKYKDGYESYSPADVFEEGYEKTKAQKEFEAKAKADLKAKFEAKAKKRAEAKAKKRAEAKAKKEAKAEAKNNKK